VPATIDPWAIPAPAPNEREASVTEIPEQEYRQILEQIESEESPVGIDAKHTHILILHKLVELERRLARIEERLEDRAG